MFAAEGKALRNFVQSLLVPSSFRTASSHREVEQLALDVALEAGADGSVEEGLAT
jgi:hypothetical protein